MNEVSYEVEIMGNKALIVIDLQNSITKNYKGIIDNVNLAVQWAESNGMAIAYIKHNNVSPGAKSFMPGTKGEEFVPELSVISENVFVKTKSSALTSEEFVSFIETKKIDEFYIVGADATACVKSTCFNMVKSGYKVHVISDCITSYSLEKIPEMLSYYSDKGCEVIALSEAVRRSI